MKNLTVVLGWTFAILFVVFGFIYFWQKEQNGYNERMMKTLADSYQTQAVEIVEEKRNLVGTIWDGIKSFAGFCISIIFKS